MRRALGKGLSQLLGDAPDVPTTSVPVDDIRANVRQPRTQFDQDALEELASSIREFGVLQPLIVRPTADNKFELIAGERRLRASKLAGLKEVPVVVRAASAQTSLEIALIENVQREDITAMETAVAYQRLSDEFDMSQEKIAQRVGKSRAAVANTMRLLKLPQAMQQAVYESALSEGHARALLMVDSPVRQMALFEKILSEGLSVREAERLARAGSEARPPSAGSVKKEKAGRPNDPHWEPLQRGLSEYFGTVVRLEKSEVGGKMVLDFYSDDDLQRILDILGISL